MLKEEFDPKSVDLTEYECQFTESAFWHCLKSDAEKLGEDATRNALRLFYCYKSPNTPVLEKSAITGALGYMVSYFDVIPDSMPVIGLADDIAIINDAVAKVNKYIDESVESAANQKFSELFR